MTGSVTLAEAELDARKTRSAFLRTATAMRNRFEPRQIATRAVVDVQARATDLVHHPVSSARHRPVVAILLAASAVVWMVRRSRRSEKDPGNKT